jgi:hypothetical protein
MQTEQNIVTKWLNTGFLRGVKPHHQQHVAERLENASRRMTGGNNRSALDDELMALDRAGYFGKRR